MHQKEFYSSKNIKVEVVEVSKKEVTLRVHWDNVAWKDITLNPKDTVTVDTEIKIEYSL